MFIPIVVVAGNLNHQRPFDGSGKTMFIENKGQIVDQNNKPNPAVLYLLNTPGFNVQLRNGGFSYDVYTVEYKQNPNPLKPFIGKNAPDSLLPEY